MTRENLIDYINQHYLAMLGTIDKEHMPHVAPIYYYYKEGGFYFITPDSTKKYKNILNNKDVFLSIVDEQRSQVASVIGVAEVTSLLMKDVIPNLAEARSHQRSFDDKWPLLYFKDTDKIIIKILVTNINYKSYNNDGTLVEEDFSLSDLLNN